MKLNHLNKAEAILIFIFSVTFGYSFNVKMESASANDRGGKEQTCSTDIGLQLYNGRIITMDGANRVASSITIKNDRIVTLSIATSDHEDTSCLRRIDLQGRTVIPGLIDSHVHFIRAGSAPGQDLRLAETTSSIVELLDLIRAATQNARHGKAITIIGGLSPQQFAENRFPTLQELDSVSLDHIVYVQQGFAGPAFTNSAGKIFFAQKGITIAKDGRIKKGKPTVTAFTALKSIQTHQDRVRGLQRLQKYANSLGLTTVVDEAGVSFPGAGFFDPENDYQIMLDLWRNKKLTVRIRAQRLFYDNDGQAGKVEEFLANAWPLYGDGFLKVTALGEHIVSFPRKGHINSAYASKIRKIALKGWSHEQHSTSSMENLQHIGAIELVQADHSITDLRWSLSHVFEIGQGGDMSTINRLKSMGMGLRLQNQGYSVPTHTFPLGRTLGGDNAGPQYRTLLDSNIRLGAGTDGPLLGPINPWVSIYYMLTGKDASGKLVNKGQTLTRLEALGLYTRNNTWFTFDEQELGSLEVGKKADLVVLNKDYLSLPVQEIKTLRSVLTIVNGKLVYTDPDTPLTPRQ